MHKTSLSLYPSPLLVSFRRETRYKVDRLSAGFKPQCHLPQTPFSRAGRFLIIRVSAVHGIMGWTGHSDPFVCHAKEGVRRSPPGPLSVTIARPL